MGTHTWKSSHSWRCHVGSDAVEPEIIRKAEGQRITNHEYIQDIYTQGSGWDDLWYGVNENRITNYIGFFWGIK